MGCNLIDSRPSEGGPDTIPCRAACKRPDLAFSFDSQFSTFNLFFVGYFIFSLLLSVYGQVMKFTD